MDGKLWNDAALLADLVSVLSSQFEASISNAFGGNDAERAMEWAGIALQLGEVSEKLAVLALTISDPMGPLN